MEAIEDVSYLERVRKMGEGDLRMLTEVITKLKSGAVTRRKGEAQVPVEKAGSMGASAAGVGVRHQHPGHGERTHGARGGLLCHGRHPGGKV